MKLGLRDELWWPLGGKLSPDLGNRSNMPAIVKSACCEPDVGRKMQGELDQPLACLELEL